MICDVKMKVTVERLLALALMLGCYGGLLLFDAIAIESNTANITAILCIVVVWFSYCYGKDHKDVDE